MLAILSFPFLDLFGLVAAFKKIRTDFLNKRKQSHHLPPFTLVVSIQPFLSRTH